VSLKAISLLQAFSGEILRIYGTSCGLSASVELLVTSVKNYFVHNLQLYVFRSSHVTPN